MTYFTSLENPHFNSLFALGANGRVLCNEQNSPDDVTAACLNLLLCPQGAKLGDPTFGVPPLLFQTIPLDTSGITQALATQEPRATTNITSVNNAFNAAIQQMTVQVGAVGSPTETTTS
jgi:hypothetical protein